MNEEEFASGSKEGRETDLFLGCRDQWWARITSIGDLPDDSNKFLSGIATDFSQSDVFGELKRGYKI